MRLPFFRNPPDAEPQRAASQRTDRARGPVPEPAAGGVEVARRHARQRLVGALVLLLAGVVAFPLFFETQPRPLPVDIPIRVGEGVLTSSNPAPRAPALPLATLPVEVLSEPLAASAPALPAALPASQAVPRPLAASQPVPAAAPRVVSPAVPAIATAAPPARALASPAPRASAPALASSPSLARVATPAAPEASAAGSRFVVQVGAYTDARTLKEARAKVEKLGLQTFTQVIEGSTGKRTRVRLGPFATRAEAQAAADKLKRAGLPADILAL